MYNSFIKFGVVTTSIDTTINKASEEILEVKDINFDLLDQVKIAW